MKNKNLNIGLVIFSFIFVYLIATIVIYITTPRISVYEVRQGSILKDNAYTGLALREETVIYAQQDGYVNYYAEEASKVRVGTKIYTISNEKIDFEVSNDTELALTEEDMHSFVLKIQSYNDYFEESDYATTYRFKEELRYMLDKRSNQSKSDQLENMLSSGTYPDITVNTTDKDGIVIYSVDGMEGLNLQSVITEQLKKSTYSKQSFSNNRQITSGEPVYKLITNDNWKLLVAISEETKTALADKKTVNVNFKKDNQEIRADISFLENMDSPTICLSFQDSMVRYANERYLDIELIIEDQSGLKIPKTAKTEKQFYVVPKEYITEGGNSSNGGVLRQRTDSDGKQSAEFIEVTIYNESDEMVYLDPSLFQKGDVLLKTDSSESYPLNEKASLPGVYSVNKGYAVFKQIQILCESDEYYIIQEGSLFGLSNYDHIALDSQGMKENDIVF